MLRTSYSFLFTQFHGALRRNAFALTIRSGMTKVIILACSTSIGRVSGGLGYVAEYCEYGLTYSGEQ